jgi:serine/threonine-protein kinase
MIGQEIGSYKLVSKIGEGGMGEVYVGEHLLLRRRVAVKLLLKQFTAEESVVKRFINEAKATSQIQHPGIVQIIDFGKAPDGSTFMIMELLEGETLLHCVRRRSRLPIAEAVAIIKQTASALAAAHALHVVHRDLKPENIFLVKDPAVPFGQRVKVLDFGIAKMLGPEVSGPHTKTGSVLGTPIYMSPEQCLAQPKIDHRADLYSLGCVFFHLVCGKPPFDHSGIGELLGAHVYSPPPVPSTVNAAISPSLDSILIKMLAKKPDDRYASMNDLIAALDALPASALETPDVTDRDQVAPAMAQSTDLNLQPPSSTPDAPTMMESPGARTPIEPPKPKTPPPTDAPPPVAVLPPLVIDPKPRLLTTAPGVEPQPRKEITTLGGATGERENAIPQPTGRRQSSMVTMGVAFGLTITLALGGFFLFGRGGGDPTPAVMPPAPAQVTLTVETDPPGAEVWRAGAILGTTPFTLRQAATAGEASFLLKKAGYDDAPLTIAADRDVSKRVTLVATKPAH